MTDLAITSAIASNYQGMIAMVGADHRVYLGKPENCYLSPEGDAPAYHPSGFAVCEERLQGRDPCGRIPGANG